MTYTYKPHHEVPVHFHDLSQFLYARTGVMSVMAGDELWLIPPDRAIWIPAGIEHTITMHSEVEMRSIYLRHTLVPRMGKACEVVNVTPLLRELLLRACALNTLSVRRTPEAHVLALLVDEVQNASKFRLSLRFPKDVRALRFAHACLDHNTSRRAVSDLVRNTGASRRTLERIFRSETGISLGHWTRQASLMEAIRALGQGHKVSAVADECGYASVSAFVAMFRRELGVTPAKYMLDRARDR